MACVSMPCVSADPVAQGEGGGEGEQAENGGEKKDVGANEEERDPLSATPPLFHPVIPSSSTISSVAQLDALLRVHIMMAQLHGLGSQMHWDLTMAALAYCSLIWKVCWAMAASAAVRWCTVTAACLCGVVDVCILLQI